MPRARHAPPGGDRLQPPLPGGGGLGVGGLRVGVLGVGFSGSGPQGRGLWGSRTLGWGLRVGSAREGSTAPTRVHAQENCAILAELLALRAEKARLLGYPSHADYVLEMNMARDSPAVADFLGMCGPRQGPRLPAPPSCSGPRPVVPQASSTSPPPRVPRTNWPALAFLSPARADTSCLASPLAPAFPARADALFPAPRR